MSIASAILQAQQRVANAYTAISAKGGTLPATQNLANMPTAIGSISTGGTIDSLTITPTTSQQTITASGSIDGYSPITVNAVTSSIDANITAGNIKNGVQILGVTGSYTGGGIIPSGTYNITLNGTYNIKNYANVYVNVPTTITGYTEFPPYQVSNGVASKRSGALAGNEFSNITSVDSYCFYYAFYGCTGLTGPLNLSSLSSIGNHGLTYAFYECTGLTSVDLSSVSSVDNSGLYNAFYGCTGLTSVDLSSLSSVDDSGLYYAFYGCTGLTSVDLSSLISVGTQGLNSSFRNCTGLTSVDLSSLSSVGRLGFSNAFSYCEALTNVYFNSLTTSSFGSYTNQFSSMLNRTGTSVTHTLHFPSNLESTISGLSGYPLFGGTSGYVTLSFDLPATS